MDRHAWDRKTKRITRGPSYDENAGGGASPPRLAASDSDSDSSSAEDSAASELPQPAPEPAAAAAAAAPGLPAPVPVQPEEFDELLDFMTLCFGQGDFQEILPRHLLAVGASSAILLAPRPPLFIHMETPTDSWVGWVCVGVCGYVCGYVFVCAVCGCVCACVWG